MTCMSKLPSSLDCKQQSILWAIMHRDTGWCLMLQKQRLLWQAQDRTWIIIKTSDPGPYRVRQWKWLLTMNTWASLYLAQMRNLRIVMPILATVENLCLAYWVLPYPISVNFHPRSNFTFGECILCQYYSQVLLLYQPSPQIWNLYWYSRTRFSEASWSRVLAPQYLVSTSCVGNCHLRAGYTLTYSLCSIMYGQIQAHTYLTLSIT